MLSIIKKGKNRIFQYRFQKYIYSGHFIQATFENWESEFLQMALFVVLTISFTDKKDLWDAKCEGKEEVIHELH